MLRCCPHPAVCVCLSSNSESAPLFARCGATMRHGAGAGFPTAEIQLGKVMLGPVATGYYWTRGRLSDPGKQIGTPNVSRVYSAIAIGADACAIELYDGLNLDIALDVSGGGVVTTEMNEVNESPSASVMIGADRFVCISTDLNQTKSTRIPQAQRSV